MTHTPCRRAAVTRSAHPVPRRAILRGLLIAPTLAVPACGSAAPDNLDDAVDRLVDHLDPDGPYRHPTPAERDHAIAQKSWLDRQRYRPQQWSTQNRWMAHEPSFGAGWMGFLTGIGCLPV